MERQSARINNAFYEDLGESWYDCSTHPIALLRAENSVRNPWILNAIPKIPCDILDIGCGAGFLTNTLAHAGHRVTGIDQSGSSLAIATKKDLSQSVRYLQSDAFALPFPDQSFDVVCAMDFLEHIEHPALIVKEAARLLKPGGQFFFHTFNRNWLSYLLVIKGVDWCIPNAPTNMHLYSMFIKPQELKTWCEESKLTIKELHGLTPRLASLNFWKSLFTRKIEGIEFQFTTSLTTGYLGYAQKT